MVTRLGTITTELLSLFGATRSATSASRLAGQSADAAQLCERPDPPRSAFDLLPKRSASGSQSGASGRQEVDQATGVEASVAHRHEPDSGDELHSDSNIIVMPKPSTSGKPKKSLLPQATRWSARQQPKRASRATVNYARPKRNATRPERITKTRKRKPSRRLLVSDTLEGAASSEPSAKPSVQTARNKVRNDIAASTKPRRDAFILAHKTDFLPLLPEHNFIRKLELSAAPIGNHVPYVALAEQPQGVKATMKPYQLEGLSFLVHMYKNGMSAMLGDEMGLGKTLQTLSLFQYLAENHPMSGENRPHLIVCPLSVLSSWMSETRKWVPDLNVIRFHGPRAERDRIKKECLESHQKRGSVDVFVTTYETFVAEHAWFKRVFVWRYCVLDEGHKVKNSESDISSALQTLSAEFRLLLTGTPVQNNLVEMWSLLHWLYPEVFTDDTVAGFKSAFDLTRGKVSTNFMDDARRLLQVIMLRRMKSSPGVNLGLPPKEEVLLFVPLTPVQRFWYQRLITKTDEATLRWLFADAREKEEASIKEEEGSDQLAVLQKVDAALDNAENLDASEVWAEHRAIMEQALKDDHGDREKVGWRKLMNLLMQLRKVCSHPYLVPGAAPKDYRLGEHVKTASGKFIVLDKLVEELVLRQGKKVLIFSGFTRTLDFCEDLLTLKGGNTHHAPFRFARLDGSTGRAQRNLSIRLFNDANTDFRVMLLSTRAGGLGINLTSATNVVFMDEDWNPQMTLQAEARAHRIGQQNKVTVYKICSQGTVEEQMMGRIRKKLYLSAKITESMRNLGALEGPMSAGNKRKRQSSPSASASDDAPHLDTTSLQSLLRRGAQTLARPQIDVTEMLDWDWKTMLERCKDKPADVSVYDKQDRASIDIAKEESAWLNSIEKVECSIFEGKRHQKHEKDVDSKFKAASLESLDRSARREGKNTTVKVNGYMINKQSLLCADWEAVPTLAGKDPRLAEPVREKRALIEHQSFCQSCWDGGQVVCCVACPRTYHAACLAPEFRRKAQGGRIGVGFHCPQHACRDCGAKTADAGGLIFRCRWCESGYCEDCLDWSHTTLIGSSLPEFEMLGFEAKAQAYFVECPRCTARWKENPAERTLVEGERRMIQERHEAFLAHEGAKASVAAGGSGLEVNEFDSSLEFSGFHGETPNTISEVATPVTDMSMVEGAMTASLGGARKRSKRC